MAGRWRNRSSGAGRSAGVGRPRSSDDRVSAGTGSSRQPPLWRASNGGALHDGPPPSAASRGAPHGSQASGGHGSMTPSSPLKVLYFCEGFTDIRFVVGLSEICELTLATPAWEFRVSGLADRIAQSGARLTVHEIHGRRPAFQLRSLLYLLRNIRKYDVVLSQEMVRGSMNATVVGKLMGVPVVTYLGVAPVEYFRCRRERGRIGWLKAVAGEAFIRLAMIVSGRLSTISLGMGPYLRDVAARTSPRTGVGGYYGVDVALFHPVDSEERRALRRRHGLPEDCFLIFFSSRISHE